MTIEIRPTLPDDLPELSRFLLDAFGTSAEAPFASPEILSWKLFDPMGGREVTRGLDARENGRIVGHIGIHPTVFSLGGPDSSRVEHPAIHSIDWVVSTQGRGAGIRLLRQVHRLEGIHFAIGCTPSSAAMAIRTGYEVRQQIPVFRKVLRPWHRLRRPGDPPLKRWAGAIRDALGSSRKARSPRNAVSWEPVPEFGNEVGGIVAHLGRSMGFTDRDPELLNHLLRFPFPWFSGGLIRQEGAVRGFAILGVVPRDGVKVGKLVDCLLDGPDPDLWLATIREATEELRRRGADLVECFGSTPRMASALSDAGFRSSFTIPLYLKDPNMLIPEDLPLHLTQLEADYSYT